MAYSFGGIDLETTYGLRIENVKGPFDFPQRLSPTEYSWYDENGVQPFTDEDELLYLPRDIILKVWLKATTESDFYTKRNSLVNQLLSVNEKDLILQHGYNTYRCYFRDGSPLKRLTRWNGNKNVGSFLLNFHEPNPIYPGIWRNLNGHWILDLANKATDQTDYGNDGTLVGAPTYGTDRNSEANGAMVFDGGTQYVDLETAFQDMFRDSFTISLWFKADDGQPAAAEYLLGSETAGGDDLMGLSIQTSGKLQFSYKSDGDAKLADTNTAVLSNGAETWHHVAITADDLREQMSIYFNDTLQALDATNDGDMSAITMSNWTSAVKVFLAAYSGDDTAASHFAGSLSDVRFYNRLLSYTEIKVLAHMYKDESLDL